MAGLMISAVTRAYAQQDVTFHFMDYKSRRPIKNLNVMIETFNGDWAGGKVANRTLKLRTSRTTDKDGQITVWLSDITPEHIRISSFDLAGGMRDFSLGEVLKYGAVVQYKRGTGEGATHVLPKPGEISFFTRQLTAGDRIRKETP